MIEKFLSLSHVKKQVILALLDAFIICLVALISLSIYSTASNFIDNYILLIFISPLLAVSIFIYYGLYREIIRYMGFDSLWIIFKAVSIYALLWGLCAQLFEFQYMFEPVFITNWSLTVIAIIGSRVFGKWFFSHSIGTSQLSGKNVVVYGAGSAGRQLVIALSQSSEYNPVAFIDDSSEIQNNFINGIEVFSSANFEKLIKSKRVTVVLLAIPSASRARRREIIKFLEPYSILVRALPGVAEIAQGKVKIDDLHDINIKDLLGREPALSDASLLGLNIKDKVVMVTGAGGSIGSELCRQILLLNPKVLILYELSELALYQIDKELTEMNHTDVKLLSFLGSVTNTNRLEHLFKKLHVQTIYHAAAYKHVPIVELNSTEGINNNIFGTLNCAQAAINSNIETFVLISSDKAVRPTNTMGATKRFSEMILQALSINQIKTRFTMVRFGNVLGSSGSVIPLFKKQIKNGGPVTVTDPEMMRYFMTISEAVGLVIQAGAMGKGGDVFVLDMGELVNIKELAEKMIHLSGLQVKNASRPDGDIEIEYTGIRPGEKLYEELFISENYFSTNNPLIMSANEKMLAWNELKIILNELEESIIKNDHEKLRNILISSISEFKPQSEISDLLHDKNITES
jgi:FlaA1/EpsC-like NDP-sugar epimerase